MDFLTQTELVGHSFEIIRLEKIRDHWLAEFAVDGARISPFWEPASNVAELSNDEFLAYMKAQALSMTGLETRV